METIKLSTRNKALFYWSIDIWLSSFLLLRGPGILLEGGRDYTARDTKRATDLLMGPTSIATKRICDITLAQG